MYVLLQKNNDGLYEVHSVKKEKPSKGIYLKGKLKIPYQLKSTTAIRVQYGLDNYYTPTEKAKEIETAATANPSVAVVKVNNGNAVLMEIIFE